MLENFEYITIENKIGVNFSDRKLLAKVFTHTSYANEKGLESNENLEFLGDSILGFVIADTLCKKYNETVDEGKLSQVRSKIVCTDSLLEVVTNLEIGEFLQSSNQGHIKGVYKLKQYGDLIEALIAGIYIDKGFAEAKKFIERAFGEIIIRESREETRQIDYKTNLQEMLQKKKTVVNIEYVLISRSGEDHSPMFTYACEVNGKRMGEGVGKSKKIAQAHSAKETIDILNKGDNDR